MPNEATDVRSTPGFSAPSSYTNQEHSDGRQSHNPTPRKHMSYLRNHEEQRDSGWL